MRRTNYLTRANSLECAFNPMAAVSANGRRVIHRLVHQVRGLLRYTSLGLGALASAASRIGIGAARLSTELAR
jgi:hypothetical protein